MRVLTEAGMKKLRVHRMPWREPMNLKDILVYSKKSKGLIWKRTRGVHGKRGALAGLVLASGKRLIKLDSVVYHADDLVWYWHHGKFSRHPLIHIDGDWGNNLIENLKEETSVIRRNHDPRPKRVKHIISGMDLEDDRINPQEKLIAAVIKNALWYAQRDIARSDQPFDTAIAMSEPARFITGQDGALEFLTEVSSMDHQAVTKLALRALKEAHHEK